MNLPPEKADSRRMRGMFHTIAPRYDFITRAFSFGMDQRWKRKAVERASLRPGARVLDLACGTGDFALLAGARKAWAVGADLTLNMLRLAPIERRVCGDALSLPFRNATFDAVFAGYGVRNFPMLEQALSEVLRVLKPDGQLVTLDFFLPQNLMWRRTYIAYLHAQGAAWGMLLHRQPEIYTYIPRSLAGFLTAGEYTALLTRAGFGRVRCQSYLGGGIAVHAASKRGEP